MSKPSINDKELVRKNYFTTQKEAENIKDFCKTHADPILQRDDNKFVNFKYNFQTKKIKPKIETQNYYSMNQNTVEPKRNRKIFEKKESNIFKQSENDEPEIAKQSRKRFLATEYEKKNHNEKPMPSKRMSNQKNYDVVGKIFKGEELKDEIQRPHIKLSKNAGKPSEEYLRMNDKKLNIYTGDNFKKSRPNEIKEKSMNSNIFSVNTKYKTERLHKKPVQYKASQIGNLLSYDNTPYGYECSIPKPTQCKYNDLVKYISENKKKK